MSTLIGIVTVLMAIAGQTAVFYKWLSSQFRQRDEALASAITERNRIVDSLRVEQQRVDRDLSSLKEQVRHIPTQTDIEGALDRRLAPVDRKLERLMLSLASAGMLRARAPDDGN